MNKRRMRVAGVVFATFVAGAVGTGVAIAASGDYDTDSWLNPKLIAQSS